MSTTHTIICTRSKQLAESVARSLASVSNRPMSVNTSGSKYWYEVSLQTTSPLSGEMKALRGIAQNLVLLARAHRNSRLREDRLLRTATYAVTARANWSSQDVLVLKCKSVQEALDIRPARWSDCLIWECLADGRHRSIYRSHDNGWIATRHDFSQKNGIPRPEWVQSMNELQNRFEKQQQRSKQVNSAMREAFNNMAKTKGHRNGE